jgi:hypothetical protein
MARQSLDSIEGLKITKIESNVREKKLRVKWWAQIVDVVTRKDRFCIKRSSDRELPEAILFSAALASLCPSRIDSKIANF